MGIQQWVAEMSAFDDYLAAPATQTSQSFDGYLDAAPGAAAPAASAPAVTPPIAGEAPGYLASLGAGLGHGFGSTVLGAQQLLGHGAQAIGLDGVGGWLANDASQGIKRLDSQYAPFSAANPMTAGAGNIAGNVAAAAPLTAVAPEMAGAGLLTRAATGAALGAANGAITPVSNEGSDYWSQKGQQIGLGAAAGGIATPLTAAVGGAISGVTDPVVQRLAQAGVKLTPGQIAGGGWSTLENKLTSVPIIGDMIRSGQGRAVNSFNNATYNEVLAPLGQKYAGPVGQDGIEAVKNTIGDAYDSALANMTFKATDPQFQSSIANLAGLANNLPQAQQQTFKNVLQTQIFNKLGPQGNMDGQTLKGVQSELSNIARGYTSDPSFDNRQLGQAIGEIKNAVDASLPNYNAPADVQNLANANAAYANFVRLRGAAGSQGAMNNGGVFTPAQLQSAVRSADKSVGKGATATGNAPMQSFSQDAMGVLGKSYPDSGTAGRIGTAGAVGALMSHPAALMNPFVIGGSLPALAYTPFGQKAVQALMLSRPNGAQAIGNAVTNGLAPLAPSLLAPYLNR
jgi:hypothetical protein